MERITAARAAALTAAAGPTPAPAANLPRSRRLAIGDPQAPIEAFFAILDRHGALSDDGWLRRDMALVSMGDHFDWGKTAHREQATREGLTLLSWLAAHPADQVTILLGNHDLGRVCELADLDGADFDQARAEADLAYRGGDIDRELERAFVARWPMFSDCEIAARDFACFSVAQRELVTRLLRDGRARLALAASDRLLLVHAGLTQPQLSYLKVSHARAPEVAAALNAFLDERVRAWRQGPLDLSPLHIAASAATGEGRGILYHRPTNPALDEPSRFAGLAARRFDPRTLPLHLVQAIGHIRDNKCRELLAGWTDDAPAQDGRLRHLMTDGRTVSYRAGTNAHAAMIFLDGGMSSASPERYQLLDLDTGQAAAVGP